MDPKEKIGYPEVTKTNPEMEIYEGGTSWGSIILALLIVIAIGVGIWILCKTYMAQQVEIVRLESQIKYNCLPRLPMP